MERRELLKLSSMGLAAGVGGVARAAGVGGAVGPQAIYDVRTFGAVGDGKVVDSPAVNKAIEEVAAAGGGTLVFPAGVYVCFTIRLKSHVELVLTQGCVIEAAASPGAKETTGYRGGVYDAAEADSPWVAFQDYGHNHWRNSLFYADGEHDFSVTGPGLIFGKGLSHGQGGSRGDYCELQGGAGGSGQQDVWVEALPQCFVAGFYRVEGRALCGAGYGCE